MTGLRRLLAAFGLREPNPEVLLECRRCGHTLEEPASVCPACESEEIARYEVR